MPKPRIVQTSDVIREYLAAASQGDRMRVRFRVGANHAELTQVAATMGTGARFEDKDPREMHKGVQPHIWANSPGDRETVISFDGNYRGELAAVAHSFESVVPI